MKHIRHRLGELELMFSAPDCFDELHIDTNIPISCFDGAIANLRISGSVSMYGLAPGEIPCPPPREVNKVVYEVGDCKMSIESGESVADIIAAATNGVPSSIDNQITINGNMTMNGQLSDVAKAVARDLHKHTGEGETVNEGLPADNAPRIAAWRDVDKAVTLLPACLREPIDQIDAAVFSGDPFDGMNNADANARMALMTFLNRWARALQDKHNDAVVACSVKESLG